MKIITKKSSYIAAGGPDVLFINSTDKPLEPDLDMLKNDFDFYINRNYIYVNTRGVKKGNDWRVLGFKLSKYLRKVNIKRLKLPTCKHQPKFIEGLLLGDYKFDYYKSSPKKRKNIKIYVETTNDDEIKTAINHVKSQIICRDLVNKTPEDMYSTSILEYVKELFSDTDIKVSYYNEAELLGFGMNGHLAVNRASPHPAMTIKLSYVPSQGKNKHIVLVGKGLTYDSGGLSIKTNGHMCTMKCDKAGAMTVIGIMAGISETGIEHRVTAYLGMAENMIDYNAYKPDDVLTMKNGKTVHVKNTDAEGRIVLFDNLCLAEEENPDATEIYTFATLTGAAVAAFDYQAAAMVGYNKAMKKNIKKIGKKEDEIFCEAEIHKFLLSAVDDNIADLSNMGSPNAGCQKAGLFLTKALSKKMKSRYLHLDIAGPAFANRTWGTNILGGTGFGVRTFLRYLESGSD